MNGAKDLSAIGLLDDSHGWPDGLEWHGLTRNALFQLLSLQRRPSARPPHGGRVFSSSPTLRQLMDEYNRPSARSGLLKPPSETAPARDDFARDARVETIELPSIPGKILRPAWIKDEEG